MARRYDSLTNGNLDLLGCVLCYRRPCDRGREQDVGHKWLDHIATTLNLSRATGRVLDEQTGPFRAAVFGAAPTLVSVLVPSVLGALVNLVDETRVNLKQTLSPL